MTSREKIVWPGLTPVPLEEMTPDEARRLLRSIVGQARATEAELDEIARRCGRLPLALRVAGTFLVRHANWPVQDYLNALADERSRLAKLKLKGLPKLDVAAVLGFSARELAGEDRPLAERWQTLAVFVESFDLAAAAAVWEVDADGALDGLGELVACSMVRFDPEASRYRLHDLMRDVAQVPLGVQDQAAVAARLEAARARHARHYCVVLANAGNLYLKGGEGALAGLALYDQEQRNIAAGQAWSARGIAHDDARAALAASYGATAGATNILALRLRPDALMGWLEAQCQASSRRGDRRGEGAAIGNQGHAWLALAAPERAIECYERALDIMREIGDRRGEANALSGLGNAYLRLGRRRAVVLHAQDVAIRRELLDRRGEGKALGNLGTAWLKLGKPGRAMECYEQQLAIAREPEIRDLEGEGNALFNSTEALDQLGERAEATRRARTALIIFEAICSDHELATVRSQLAKWSAEEGRSRGAPT